MPGRGGWTQAVMLRPGDLVAAYNGKTATITFVQGVPKDLTVYTICVPDTPIFFVGRQSVMVHNTELALVWSCAPAITSFWTGTAVGSFLTGPAGVLAGVAACGVALVVQALVRKHLCGYKPCAYNQNCLSGLLRAEKVPGKPTEDDGYVPPKNWDGKKVQNPNGPGYGWPDKKGHVWVPSGPRGHSGPHWDVENPSSKGIRYRNVLPGGKIR